MTSFIPLFEERYAESLNPTINAEKRGVIGNLYQRAAGFRMIFQLLEAKNKRDYHIVETGSLRKPGDWHAGQSSLLFEEFVKTHGGTVDSVDIDSNVCDTARATLGPQVRVHCSDSVAFLERGQWDDVDLFYLDSMDVKWRNPDRSAQHHLKELHAIERYLRPGVILAIDDNSHTFQDHRRTGKGMMIYEYLRSKGLMPVMDDYQIIYTFE